MRYGLIRDADPRGGAGAADCKSARWLCYEENRQRQGVFLPPLDGEQKAAGEVCSCGRIGEFPCSDRAAEGTGAGAEGAEKAAAQGEICEPFRVYHQCPHRRGAAFLRGVYSRLS